MTFVSFMDAALVQAQLAYTAGEVPIGAVITHNGVIIAAAHNRTERDADPTAHAELLAIRAACAALAEPRLEECDLYVTLEPCAMCAAAIGWARLRRVYYGAPDPKSGGVEHGARIFTHGTCHHKPEIYGAIAEQECAALMRRFFSEIRK